MDICKHTDIDISGCDSACDCWCDGCQSRYESVWFNRATKENLCLDCGIPKELTIENLIKEQYTHFFQPCLTCQATFKECMAAAKLCELCRGPLTDTVCSKCTCLDTDECGCRKCSVKPS